MINAAVCHEFGTPLKIEPINLDAPRAGEVRVALKACAICHSDISFADGAWGGALPAIYGHEASGIIETVGPDVQGYKLGDRVIATLIRHCGTCHYCANGHEVLCETDFPLNQRNAITSNATGETRHQAMNVGAFAQAIIVDQSQLHPIPDTMPFDIASLLACGVITGFGAVNNAVELKPEHHAIIIGCGGVGLNSVQAAALKGAKSVIAMDLAEDKFTTAKKFGATHTINPTNPDAVAQIMDITGGRGADLVFVTVGAKRAIEGAFDYITKTGTVVIVGMPASDVTTSFDPATLAAWSQRIIGTKMGETIMHEDLPQLIALYEEGKLKLDELISARFPLEQINEAMDGVRNGTALRNVIIFD